MKHIARRAPEMHTRRAAATLRIFVAFVLSFALLVVIGYAGQSVISRSVYPIRKVLVEGDFRFLTPVYIQALVAGSLEGGFFQIDVQKVHRQLLEEPWVADATVERVWPDSIRVAVKEQIPAARWGRSAVLNHESDIFAPNPSSLPEELPLLSGPVGSEAEVLSEYRKMDERLAALGLRISGISVSGRGAWTVKLEDDTQLILGRDDIQRRFDRFCSAFEPLLKAEWSLVAKVDLRFTNGFAVTERTASNIEKQARANG